MSFVRELLEFLWKERKWWLVPAVVLLIVVGVLIIFAQSSAVSPFIYTLF